MGRSPSLLRSLYCTYVSVLHLVLCILVVGFYSCQPPPKARITTPGRGSDHYRMHQIYTNSPSSQGSSSAPLGNRRQPGRSQPERTSFAPHPGHPPSPWLPFVQWNRASNGTGLEVQHVSHGETQPRTSPSAWDSMIPRGNASRWAYRHGVVPWESSSTKTLAHSPGPRMPPTL